jgi:ABC-type nitrate/sulfonate/bicarbonate transport system substrate-binding protein
MACGTLDSFSLALMRFPRVGIYLFSLGTSVGEDVLVASSATRLTDLKHKSVAVPQGQDYVVGLALSQAGLSPSETTMIATHTDQEALAELHQHAVQAALLWEPQLAKGGEGTSVVFTTADAKTPRIEEMCAVRPDVLHSRPAEVSSVMRTWFHIIDTLRTKPGLAREPIARATGLAVDVLGDYLKTVQLSTLAENRNALDQALLVSTIQDQQSDFKMMGKTGTASAEVSQAVNLDLLRQLPATVEEQQQQQQ